MKVLHLPYALVLSSNDRWVLNYCNAAGFRF